MLTFLRRLLGYLPKIKSTSQGSQTQSSTRSQDLSVDKPPPAALVDTPQDGFKETEETPRTVTHTINAPNSGEMEAAVAIAVKLGCSHPELVAKDAMETFSAMIAYLDRQLSDQLSEIMGAPDFRALESAWRGLHYLVSNSDTGPTLAIRVLNISKTELQHAPKSDPGEHWRQSPISTKLFDEVYENVDAAAYGLLVVDHYFDQSEANLGILRDIAQICAHCQTPVLAGVSPTLFGLTDMGELPGIANIDTVFATKEYDDWNDLRRNIDSRYIGLCLPRVRARLPYADRSLTVKGFNFEERILTDTDLVWMNSAYAMAVNVARSVNRYGWPTDIRGVDSGGIVKGLPLQTVEFANSDSEPKYPIEAALSERAESALSRYGLIPLLHRKGTQIVAFISAQSLYKPQELQGEDGLKVSTSNQILTRFPYLLVACLYAHYVMRMAADRQYVQTINDVESFEANVRAWFDQYVDPTFWSTNSVEQARRPLTAVEFHVSDADERLSATLVITPGFKVEGISPIRLNFALPLNVERNGTGRGERILRNH